MIISTACQMELESFYALMKNTDDLLNEDAKKREEYYLHRGGKLLESDVRDALTECAEGTPFAGSIELVSGASFPDIVANKFFGVEVKSTAKNHWQSIGSSILESTRDKNVERIFMTFGKLARPVEFLSKPYEDCLSEIVVTHYPRYRIDMHLQENNEKTIFQKMHVDYDTLRVMENPVPVVSAYYKRHLKPGESLWWSGDNSALPVTARLWKVLSAEEKEELIVTGYVLFPEIFGSNSSRKYDRYVLWMATKNGIINPNVRDSFSAGGKVLLPTEDGIQVKMPAAFGRINKYKMMIEELLADMDEDTLSEYWCVPIGADRIAQWRDLVIEAGNKSQLPIRSVLNRIFGLK